MLTLVVVAPLLTSGWWTEAIACSLVCDATLRCRASPRDYVGKFVQAEYRSGPSSLEECMFRSTLPVAMTQTPPMLAIV
jgi:hypothetical protein